MGALGGALVGSCVLAWPVWAWAVKRWRRRLPVQISSARDLQLLAVATGLVGPAGSAMEHAERSVRVPLAWGMVGAGIAVLVALVAVTSKGSAAVPIASMTAAGLWIAGAIVLDRTRSGRFRAWLGTTAGFVAALAWVALPRIPAPTWVMVGGVTLATVFALLLIALLAWLPDARQVRGRWTAVGLVVIASVSMAVSTASAARYVVQPAPASTKSPIQVASPAAMATWASFRTNGDRQTSPD